MNQEQYQSFPFHDFEASFKANYDCARDGDRLLIKIAGGEVPYANGGGTVMYELRKWLHEHDLECWWSREIVQSVNMWLTAGCKQIDRSVLASDHVAARKPIVVAPRPSDKRVTEPPLKPIPSPKAVSR